MLVVYLIATCRSSNQSISIQDTSVCLIWVWLLNFHLDKTQLLDMQELQASKNPTYSKFS